MTREENAVEREDLIIPVYLNQRIVFDLLAMREDGISQVTQVVSTEHSGSIDQKRHGAGFGLSKALSSLLRVDISGDRTKVEGIDSSSSTNEERVHTPASLFFRLRKQIDERGDLVRLTPDSSTDIEPHQFVEFESDLKRNPLLETIDSISSVMGMVVALEEKSPQRGKQRKMSDNEQVLEKMKSLGDDLRRGDSVDMVAYSVQGSDSALITLETEYLNDPLMADLVDGRFKVIGKVIRTVGEGESIGLLRKTAFSVIPEKKLSEMLSPFEAIGKMFDIPSLKLKIEGPAFHVLPIAIFA